MNRSFAYLFMGISLLFFVTCQENREDLNEPSSESDQYRLIGEEIPFETGMDWIAHYRAQGQVEGRTDLVTSYNVPDSQMMFLLESVNDLVGVAFHYGLDENGTKHIIVIPVDESLSLWADIPGRIMVDANTGNEISPETASAWATNYKNENPTTLWFHFFGAHIFNNMCALSFFNTVSIEPAISSLNQKPQLLLIIYNDSLLNLGRSEQTQGVVYDASNACPPCAVG